MSEGDVTRWVLAKEMLSIDPGILMHYLNRILYKHDKG
jgi:hypothetical protein